MKLTAKSKRELEAILDNLKAARAYLLREDIAGIATVTRNPNGGDYTIRNPACLQGKDCEHVTVMNKHAGSDLAQFYTATKRLELFLATEGVKA